MANIGTLEEIWEVPAPLDIPSPAEQEEPIEVEQEELIPA